MTFLASHRSMGFSELEPRLCLVVEDKHGPLHIALMTVLACGDAVMAELAIVNIFMAGYTLLRGPLIKTRF